MKSQPTTRSVSARLSVEVVDAVHQHAANQGKTLTELLKAYIGMVAGTNEQTIKRIVEAQARESAKIQALADELHDLIETGDQLRLQVERKTKSNESLKSLIGAAAS